MISNLLLFATAIYIYVNAMRTLKGFISFMFLQSWSSISYTRPVAVTGAWTKLHLLSQPSRYEVFLASENFSLGQMGAGIKLIFKSCSTLHSLTTSIYYFSSYLHATYLFRRRDCGHPTKTCLSGNVKWIRKCIIFCCTFMCIGIYWFEEMVTSCSWYSLIQGKSFFFNSSQISFILSIEI